MGHKKVDRVQQTSQSVGTGSLQLDGAAPDRMRSFGNTLSNGDTCWVLIEHQTLGEWEISFATYSGGYISRSFATGSSSSTGTLVAFSGGVKTVSLIAPAGATPIVDGNGDLYVPRDLYVARNQQLTGILDAAQAIFTYAITAKSGVKLSATGDQAIYDSGDGNAAIVVGSGGGNAYFGFLTDGTFHAPTALRFGFDQQYLYSVEGGSAVVKAGTLGSEKYWTFDTSGLFSVSNGGGRFAGDISPSADNAYDCGKASYRWANIRSVNSSIVTSDGDDKEQVGDLVAAEIRVGQRLRVRKWKMKDAVAAKGSENARWHTGWVAQEVVEDFEAEGLDPFKYGCVGFDLLDKTETYEETVTREKTEAYAYVATAIEIVDGTPVRKTTPAVGRRPVGAMVTVLDEQGAVVLVPSGEKDDEGQPILVPLKHFVPEMEEMQEPRTRTVPDLDEHGVQKKRMNVRPDELKAFILAALMSDVTELQGQVEALTPPSP